MDKTLEIANQLAHTLFSNVSHLANQYGPKAVDLVLWTVRLDGINAIFTGIICLVIVVGSIKLLPYCYKKFREFERSKEEGPCIFFGAGIFASIVACAISAIISFILLLNVWNYVAIVTPEVYLAKKTIDKVLISTK